MFRRSVHRLTATFFVALSLLFSQLALANYVCPADAEADADAEAMVQRMASGEPCSGMDQIQPVLCHQHASGAAQSFEAIKLPTATLPGLIQLLLVVPLMAGVAEALEQPIWDAADMRPPPDPIFLSTLRLRV